MNHSASTSLKVIQNEFVDIKGNTSIHTVTVFWPEKICLAAYWNLQNIFFLRSKLLDVDYLGTDAA